MKLLKVINLAHLFGIAWLLAIIVFIGVIVFGLKGGNALTEQHNTTLVYVFLTGLFAFLAAFVLYMVHYLFLRKKDRLGTPGSVKRGISPAFLIALLLLLGFGGAVAVRGAYNLGQAEKFLDAKNTVPETTPEPTVQVKYVDSDPVITCTSSYPNCSGQSIKARQSACSAITCCQVGDKWSVYPSENDCKVAQAAVAPTNKPQNNTQTKYPPCTINYSQLGAITYYTIPPEECATKQMDAKIHETQRDSYDQCVKNYGAENCTAP